MIIEGDASRVIDALNHKCSRHFLAQTIVDNIDSIRPNFVSISFSHCYRESNGVAHSIARWASNRSCNCVWALSCPIWIRELVILDLSS